MIASVGAGSTGLSSMQALRQQAVGKAEGNGNAKQPQTLAAASAAATLAAPSSVPSSTPSATPVAQRAPSGSAGPGLSVFA